MTKKLILFFAGILGLAFLGAIIFGVSVVSDRFCKIKLQNFGRESITIKSISATGNEWTMVVDSISIGPYEKFELGSCINCKTLKQSDFDFDAIVILKNNYEPKLIHRKDLSDFLSTLDRVDCATFELP